MLSTVTLDEFDGGRNPAPERGRGADDNCRTDPRAAGGCGGGRPTRQRRLSRSVVSPAVAIRARRCSAAHRLPRPRPAPRGRCRYVRAVPQAQFTAAGVHPAARVLASHLRSAQPMDSDRPEYGRRVSRVLPGFVEASQNPPGPHVPAALTCRNVTLGTGDLRAGVPRPTLRGTHCLRIASAARRGEDERVHPPRGAAHPRLRIPSLAGFHRSPVGRRMTRPRSRPTGESAVSGFPNNLPPGVTILSTVGAPLDERHPDACVPCRQSHPAAPIESPTR